MAMAVAWGDDGAGRRQEDAAIRRANAAYRARLDDAEDAAERRYRGRVVAQEGRAERRLDLIGELARIADAMAVLTRHEEFSAQHRATARRLLDEAGRALQLLDGEESE